MVKGPSFAFVAKLQGLGLSRHRGVAKVSNEFECENNETKPCSHAAMHNGHEKNGVF